MPELPIVLHVGAPKAGSSALQHDLTWNPRRPVAGRPGTTAEYVAIDALGSPLRGDSLDAFASLYAARYAASADLATLARLDPERRRQVAATLAALRAEGTIPVLSYEMWLHAAAADVVAFATMLGAPLHVVAYVRDPVSWLRSLYWQRRGRGHDSTAVWLEKKLPDALWIDALSTWGAAPNVIRLDVRLTDRSVPEDFAALVGYAPTPADRPVNGTLCGEMARFMLRRELTPALCASEMRFAWERWTEAAGVDDEFDPSPAVFDAEQVSTIIRRTRAASEALLSLCDADTGARIAADARWWSDDPALHAGRPPRHPPAAPLTESDRLLDAGLRALVAADAAWRREHRGRRLAEDRIRDLEARLASAESLFAARSESPPAGPAGAAKAGPV